MYLYVRPDVGSTCFDPWYNSGVPGSYSYDSTSGCGTSMGSCFGNGLYDAVTYPADSTSHCAPDSVVFPTTDYYFRALTDSTSDGGGNQRLVHDLYAGGRWLAQMATYEQMLQFPTLADSSELLHEFASLAPNSRFAWLHNIENYLGAGDLTSARALMAWDQETMKNSSVDTTTGLSMADGNGANYIVANYLQFYDLAIKFLTDSLNGDDTLAIVNLANLCPFTDGSVIFQARSLYNTIFATVGSFIENCIGTGSNARTTTAPSALHHDSSDAIKKNQNYRLFPNPNDGNITIEQTLPSNNFVNAVLYNATGMILVRSTLHFNNGADHMSIQNITPGLYLLQLMDSYGSVYNLKFIVK